ncbi:PAS domain-containing protein [Azospirillum sp. ST 5-10]|uniref:PAS domain-containing protein n=1 Tax=unclassified Azospirillum TaxID=2630922 RepID=UPI003F4A6AB6
MTTLKTELATPALNRLLDFWLAKCSSGNPPVSSTISPSELRPWKDHIVIFEVIGEDDFVYSYYGRALAAAWGHSRLGHTLEALPEPQRVLLTAEYEAALRERLPLARVYTGNFDGRDRTFERLVLPLSSDGVAVDKLLVAAYELAPDRPAGPPRPVATPSPSRSPA